MCSLAGFFIDHLAPFHLFSIFTCRSCCFPLEQSRSHSTPVRNAIKFEFHCLAQLFIKVPDIPCLECKTPEESSTYISRNVTTNLETCCVYANECPTLGLWKKKKKKEKQESVFYGADVCCAKRDGHLHATREIRTQMLMTQGLWCQLAGAPIAASTNGGKNMSQPQRVCSSPRSVPPDTRMHNLQRVTSNQLQMLIQACADVKENIRPLRLVHV